MAGAEAPAVVRRGRVEDQCCIDLSALYKAGRLVPSTSCVWSWSRGGGMVGAVHVTAQADAIEIFGYIYSSTGIEQVQEVLQIRRVTARFANRACGRGRVPHRLSCGAPA